MIECFRHPLSIRSSAKFRPQMGQAERSSRGLEANSDLRLAVVGAAAG